MTKLNHKQTKIINEKVLCVPHNGRNIDLIEGENWQDRIRSVANVVARAEKTKESRQKWEEKYFNIISTMKFLPNSPLLANIHQPKNTLSACFVLPIFDNMQSIFDTLKRSAMIQKAGGGVGINWGPLRESNASISGGGVSCGPLGFMRIFNTAMEEVRQGGRRRGAAMSALPVWHRDTINFINAKQDESKLTAMNLSVVVTDKFMERALDPKKPIWRFGNGGVEREEDKNEKKWTASEILDLIALRAWESGEPGILFLDRINRDNACPNVGEIETSNPCGEAFLRPNESCNLGSINLLEFVNDDGHFDYAALEEVVQIAVHFLDAVIDVNPFPDDLIDNATKATRPIGLGVMGFADALIKMGLIYGSDSSYNFADDLMSNIRKWAEETSEAIAAEKGPFPKWNYSKYGIWQGHKGKLMRNSQLLSIAPTGTLALIADCSYGIEPLFSGEDQEKKLADQDGWLYMPNKWLERGVDKKLLVSAHDLTLKQHIKMASIFQMHTDSGVSKTANAAYDSTIQDVRETLEMAWKSGLKGITIFREDCSREGVLRNVCHTCKAPLRRDGKCWSCPNCGGFCNV